MSFKDFINMSSSPTPSFTSGPISSGNEPGGFKPLWWLLAGLLVAIIFLVIIAK